MIFLWICLGIAAFLTLLFATPVHVSISASMGEQMQNGKTKASAEVTLKVLLLRFRLFPAKKASQAKSEKKKRKTNAEQPAGQSKEKKKKEGILSLLDLILALVKKLVSLTARYLHVTVKQYDIAVGTEDCAKTALLYGAVAQATSYLFAFLDEQIHFKVKGKDTARVYADFLLPSTRASVLLDFRLRVGQALHIALGVALEYVKKKNEKTVSDASENNLIKTENNLQNHIDRNVGKAVPNGRKKNEQ